MLYLPATSLLTMPSIPDDNLLVPPFGLHVMCTPSSLHCYPQVAARAVQRHTDIHLCPPTATPSLSARVICVSVISIAQHCHQYVCHVCLSSAHCQSVKRSPLVTSVRCSIGRWVSDKAVADSTTSSASFPVAEVACSSKRPFPGAKCVATKF